MSAFTNTTMSLPSIASSQPHSLCIYPSSFSLSPILPLPNPCSAIPLPLGRSTQPRWPTSWRWTYLCWWLAQRTACLTHKLASVESIQPTTHTCMHFKKHSHPLCEYNVNTHPTPPCNSHCLLWNVVVCVVDTASPLYSSHPAHWPLLHVQSSCLSTPQHQALCLSNLSLF